MTFTCYTRGGVGVSESFKGPLRTISPVRMETKWA
ncbi:unnamed protein product [Acanthoscelides obtectus]|uniref:Uncharacterized protein n=1 Tax=Acanthoscelides obtectus TaxID=200917 RepID=A0A9P0PZ29_ACAOB|nr:unnamed protein product [Acanthoscelides obtectus]CAK1687714.1 hypothetical protein AOBTE_LOCUS36333 [Acanthoscelides obtectus]